MTKALETICYGSNKLFTSVANLILLPECEYASFEIIISDYCYDKSSYARDLTKELQVRFGMKVEEDNSFYELRCKDAHILIRKK